MLLQFGAAGDIDLRIDRIACFQTAAFDFREMHMERTDGFLRVGDV